MTETKAAEVEVEEEVKTVSAVNALSVALPEGGLRKALNVLFVNAFGNNANKQIYRLQKEIGPYAEEYRHLKSKIAQVKENVEEGGKEFSEAGIVELTKLHVMLLEKEVKFETPLPIKVPFLDCFSSNDRIILEETGIVEFEE